jgi:hypothetical protein
MKDDELKTNGNQDVEQGTEANDEAYIAPRLYVAGKTVALLRGGNMGSLEDFAKRFKSQTSG